MRPTARRRRPVSPMRQVRNRLKRLQGQVAGIEKMVNEGRYCVDIILQVSAARAALDQVGLRILALHISHSVDGTGCQSPVSGPLTKSQQLDELRAAVQGLLGHSEEAEDPVTPAETEEEIS